MPRRIELKPNTQFKGLDNIRKNLGNLNDIKVGVLRGTGEHPNADNGQTVAEIAWWNEFGTDKIPARPFLRPTMRENRRRFKKAMAAIYKKVMNSEITAAAAIESLGMLAQSLVRQAIDKTISPPNAILTLLKKAPKTHPLIHTGRLRQSIDYAEDK